MHAPFAFTRYRRAGWLLWLLLPALMLAQWAGLSHRMAHAGRGGAQPAQPAYVRLVDDKISKNGDQNTLHSCALYDAAASADYLHACAPATPYCCGTPLVAGNSTGLPWHAPLTLSFRSRAPPFLNA